MKWLTDLLDRWRIARDARHENYLRQLAISRPGFEWILVRAGSDIQSRSPMLGADEIRDWFREFYPHNRIAVIDHENKIVFYE